MPLAIVDGLRHFSLVCVMVVLIFVAGYYDYLIEKPTRRLHEMANTDHLTGLMNRRAAPILQREESRLLRGHGDGSFVLCDLDHFKSINDSKGHGMGDHVL